MIIKNAEIFTNSDAGFIHNGWIKVEGDEIKEIGEGTHPQDEDIIDVHGRLLLPGFVNAHTHMYSALARGIPLDIRPRSFYEILRDLWWKLDKGLERNSIYYSALIGGIESLKSGVTALIDHHASYGYIKGSLNILKETLVDTLGLRVDLCYEISDRWGEKESRLAQEESFEFLEYVKGLDNPLLSSHIGLHASFTLKDETLKNVVNNTPGDIGFHIHVAEGIEDQIDAIKRYGKRTIKRLDDLGILREKTIVVHGVHLSNEEKEIIKKRGVYFAHAPQSNMNNAVGTAHIKDLLEKDINVALGNDGFGFNILNDLRVMMLLQKHVERDFNRFGFDDLYKVFLVNNYRLLNTFFPGSYGKIAPGHKADFVVLEYSPPTPLNGGNLLGHLIFGLADRLKVDKVFIEGKLRVDKGKVLGIDEVEIYKEAQKVASYLWDKILN